jgi:pimeloyl-ACP methyl ester carboxylesterase
MRLNEPHCWIDALKEPTICRSVNVAGADIRFRAWGDEDSDKPVALLIHGYRGHSHWWDWVAPLLTKHYRPIALDFSGMGDSGRRPRYDGATFIDDLLCVVDHLDARRVIGIGHSFGGCVLLRACAKRATAFESLVIIDSRVRFPDIADQFVRMPSVRRPPIPDFTEASARFRLLPKQPVSYPQLLQHVAGHSLREVVGGWAWKFDPNLPLAPVELDDSDMLRSIVVPVSYIHAERSQVVDNVMAQRIVSELRYASGPYVIPFAHHHVMFDKPSELVGVLYEILDC